MLSGSDWTSCSEMVENIPSGSGDEMCPNASLGVFASNLSSGQQMRAYACKKFKGLCHVQFERFGYFSLPSAKTQSTLKQGPEAGPAYIMVAVCSMAQVFYHKHDACDSRAPQVKVACPKPQATLAT